MRAPDLGPGLSAVDILGMLWPDHHITTRRRPRLAGETTTFAMVPSRGAATLLLPTAPRAVVGAALKGYKSPSSRAGRVRMRVSAAAGYAGFGRVVPGTVAIAPTEVTTASADAAPSLLAHLEQCFGQPLHAGIHLGPPRANRKPVLQLMAANGRTVGFAKVGINQLTSSRVRHEGEALKKLAEVDLGILQVPRLVAYGTWRDCAYAAMEPVSTWSRLAISPDHVGAAMRALVSSMPAHSVPLAESQWWLEIEEGLTELTAQHGEQSTPTELDAADLNSRARQVVSRGGDRELRMGACHGDWTPWNMAVQKDRVVAWDWERFATATPVGWDGLHYRFQQAVNVAGTDVHTALENTRQVAGDAVAMNGADREDAELLYLLYLVRLGYRFVREGQLQAGSRRGPLRTWLIPALDEALRSKIER